MSSGWSPGSPASTGGQVIEPAVDRRRGFTAVLVHLQERPAAQPGRPALQPARRRRTGPRRARISSRCKRPARPERRAGQSPPPSAGGARQAASQVNG